MGAAAGPDIADTGLVLALDAADRKTFANSVINSTSWSLGSGSAPSYSQNGLTVENERVTGTDPFGRSAIVWETRPSGDGNPDGGWETSWNNIDNTKLYRFSVWVKRTSTTSGGTFYLGLYGNGTGIRRTDTSAYEGNPYWECSGTSKFDKDVWYLVVGHCYPYSTTYTGQHPESGIYTVAGGTTKVLSINACNIGTDVKWAGSDVTQTIHRCYHYYCGDNTTRLQLFDPRIDVIDGTEPSIANLLSGFTASRLTDLVGNNNGTFINGPIYSSANGGSIVFDATDDYIDCGLSSFQPTAITLCAWVKHTVSSDGGLIVKGDVNEATEWGLSFGYSAPHYIIGRATTFNNQLVHPWTGSLLTGFHYVCYTMVNNTRASLYVDGVQVATTNTIGSIGLNAKNVLIGKWNNYAPLNGSVAQAKIYNRELSATEIQQNFNATRRRFGI